MIKFSDIIKEEDSNLKQFDDYKSDLPDVWARFNIVRDKNELRKVYRNYDHKGIDHDALVCFYHRIIDRFMGRENSKKIVSTQIIAGSNSYPKR